MVDPQPVKARALAWIGLLLAAWWPPVHGCNPAPPLPPILEGYAWDAVAAEYLLRDARSVVAARFKLRLDVELDAAAAPLRASYVFEVLEGWKEVTPRQLTLNGYWVPCALQLRAGQVYLLYVEGERLLHGVPVEQLDFELGILGEPHWFYDARGRLMHPTD